MFRRIAISDFACLPGKNYVIAGCEGTQDVLVLMEDVKETEDDLDNISKTKAAKRHKATIKRALGKPAECIETKEKLIPIPLRPHQMEEIRQNLLVCGPEGCGKSYFCFMYVNQFRRMFPDRRFILFSTVENDDKLNSLGPIQVQLDETLSAKPLECGELADSLVLFDDIESIYDKKLKKSVELTRDACLKIGRHHCIYTLSVLHNPTDGHSTKASLAESSAIVLFPSRGDAYRCQKVMKTYCGLDNKTIEWIMKLDSRWVMISKRAPMFVLWETGVCRLH